jgi:non-ribosomal peptide synthetase component E (peptide arylation enzyme)/3-hydroxymyristoyl/3-hydroxydecanoyl-(acyl carrier protein) dehydratase
MVRLRPTLEFRRGHELVTHVVALPEAIWFQGHFPSAPLLPGVAMLAMVEESVGLFWSDALHPALRIESLRRVRFRQRVEPGANLRVRIRQTQPQTLRFAVEVGGFAACTGECSVVAESSSGGSRWTGVEMSAPPWAGRSSALFSLDGTMFTEVALRASGLCQLTSAGLRPCVCVASEDRVVVAAAVLAALSGAIETVFPAALSPEALLASFVARRFSHWLGPAEWHSSVPGLEAHRVESALPTLCPGDLHISDVDAARIFLQTGGTTGQPRLWQKTAGNLLGEVASHVRALQVETGDHIVATVSPHHIYGLLFSVLLPLVSDATVERVSPFFPQEIAERIAKSSATILVSTPAHLRALSASLTSRHKLRLVLSSGAPLSAADAASFFARTGLWPLEVYGSTETGGIAVRRQDEAEASWAPLPAVECRLDGDVLCVRSPFVSPDAAKDEDGFFSTADRARERPDGRFELLGRADGVVKVGGKRVDLPDIEKILAALDRVQDAVVMALPSESGRGQEIVALVASNRPAGDITRELREKLPSPSWPRRLRCVPVIPTTSVGKRDRVAILELLAVPTREPSGK